MTSSKEQLVPVEQLKPRRPLDDDNRNGYMESDRDFLLNNLQTGVAGFGETPNLAMYAFDTAWLSKTGSHIIEPVKGQQP